MRYAFLSMLSFGLTFLLIWFGRFSQPIQSAYL